MPATIIKVADVAAPFINDLKTEVATMKPAPLLVSFLANSDPAAKMYADWTAKTCQATGIRFELRTCDRTKLEDMIVEANNDDSVHGIMVYYPVFGGSQDNYLQNTVSYRKDVEGLCHRYRYNMYHNIRYLDEAQQEKCIIPCTPLAIVKILEHINVYNKTIAYGNRLYGRTITIINRSEVVGRPLAALLANDGARVISVDVDGLMEYHRGENIQLKEHQAFETQIQLAEALKISDVVITGVPSASYKVHASQLKDGVVAVNFSTEKNFDDSVKQKASIYVPSVGKVTVSMLERNLLRLYHHQTQQAAKQ